MIKIKKVKLSMSLLFASTSLYAADVLPTDITPATQPTKQLKVKTKDWGDKFAAVSAVFGNASRDRTSLESIQNEFKDRLHQESLKNNPDYVSISHDLSIAYKGWIKTIIDTLIQDMGATPCDFAIATMGSLARGEGNFFSDLEIAFLVENKDVATMRYFTKLSQKLSDRIYLLGQHPIVGNMGIHMDGADHAPFRNAFHYRFADPKHAATEKGDKQNPLLAAYEGHRFFIATPNEFARHSDADFVKSFTQKSLLQQKSYIEQRYNEELKKELENPANKDKTFDEISQETRYYINLSYGTYSEHDKYVSKAVGEALNRNIGYMYGSEKLYDQLAQSVKRHFGKPINAQHGHGQKIALSYLKIINTDFPKKISYFKDGKMPNELHIKKDLYRYIEQIMTNYALYYGINTTGSYETAQALIQCGLINRNLGEKLKKVINHIIGLRLKQQAMIGKSAHCVFASEKAHKKAIVKFENVKTNLVKKRDLLISKLANKHSPKLQASLRAIEVSILEADGALDEIRKSGPGQIMTAQDVAYFENDVFPVLIELEGRVKRWLHGNKRALAQHP